MEEEFGDWILEESVNVTHEPLGESRAEGKAEAIPGGSPEATGQFYQGDSPLLGELQTPNVINHVASCTVTL